MPAQSIVFSPELDERQLDRETDTVDELLKEVARDVPLTFDAEEPEVDGVSGGAVGGGGVGGGGVGAGTAAGLASRIPKPIAGVATKAALPVALAGAVGAGLVGAMTDASSRLQTTASILGQAQDNVFRPLGDELSDGIRPAILDIKDATEDFEETYNEGNKTGALLDLFQDLKGEGGLAIDFALGTGDGEGGGFFQSVFERFEVSDAATGGPLGPIFEFGESAGAELASRIAGSFSWPEIPDVDLNDYVTDVSLPEFVTSVNLRSFVEDVDLGSFVDGVNLRSFVDGVSLGDFVTNVNLGSYVTGVSLSSYVGGVDLDDYVGSVSLGDYVTGVSLGDYLDVPDWLSSGEQPEPQPTPPVTRPPRDLDRRDDDDDRTDTNDDDGLDAGGFGDELGGDPADSGGGIPSGGGAGAGGGTGGGTIAATGGFVSASGRATIHEGERILPESQVSDRGEASFDPSSIAEGIRRAGGLGGDMSAVEDKLDRLHRDLARLERAFDVTVSIDGRDVAKATAAQSNTDPIARR